MGVMNFFVLQVMCRLVGVRIEETEDLIILHSRSAKIANAILANVRKRAERENNLEPLKLLRVVLDP